MMYITDMQYITSYISTAPSGFRPLITLALHLRTSLVISALLPIGTFYKCTSTWVAVSAPQL